MGVIEVNKIAAADSRRVFILCNMIDFGMF